MCYLYFHKNALILKLMYLFLRLPIFRTKCMYKYQYNYITCILCLLLLTVICFQNILSDDMSLNFSNNGRFYMIMMCKFIIYIAVDITLPLWDLVQCTYVVKFMYTDTIHCLYKWVTFVYSNVWLLFCVFDWAMLW